jgi:hypothetical protein
MDATARAWRRSVNQRFFVDLRRRLGRAPVTAPAEASARVTATEPLLGAATMELSRSELVPGRRLPWTQLRDRRPPGAVAVVAGAGVLLAVATVALLIAAGPLYRHPGADLTGRTASPQLAGVPPRPTPAPGGMSVIYQTTDTWAGGYAGQLTITASADVTGWTASLTFPAQAQLTTIWEAQFQQRGSVVTLTPTAGNGALAAGKTIHVGFEISLAGGNDPTHPLTCSVDGVACASS